jgi:hypothetical protein
MPNSQGPRQNTEEINSTEIEKLCRTWAEVARAILMRRKARDDERQEK